jgi:pimeloyl-ACP methyl ester carboxylesterase
MKTSFHRIYTNDGLELHGLLYKPDNESRTVLAQVHGMAGNFYENKYLDSLANTLTRNNIAFSPFNNRGNGHITTFVKRNNDKIEYVKAGNAHERFEDCLIDIKSHIDFLESQGFTNIHLSGHSLGAPKVVYYLSKSQDKRIKSLILLSPADMIGLVKDNEQRFKEEITEAEKLVKEGNGNSLLSREVYDEYPISANTYLNFFGNDSKIGVLNFHKKEDEFKALSLINQPMLTVMGRKDDVLIVPIEEIMETIKKKAISSRKCEYNILGEATHDYRGFEQELANSVLDWLKNETQENTSV